MLRPLVVDCSMIATLLYQEDQCEEAERRLTDRELHAPDLLDYEFAERGNEQNSQQQERFGGRCARVLYRIPNHTTSH